ncbi:MAG: DUF4912 domain-containing protein [Planctomycetota bacterium]|jgi:hypothetical protein
MTPPIPRLRLHALIRDPACAFLYWDVASPTASLEAVSPSLEQPLLRVEDLESGFRKEIAIHLEGANYYLDLIPSRRFGICLVQRKATAEETVLSNRLIVSMPDVGALGALNDSLASLPARESFFLLRPLLFQRVSSGSFPPDNGASL